MTRWTEAWPLAAATLGAPGESLPQVLQMLAATGTRLLELRAAPGQLADVELGRADRRRLLVQLRSAGVRVLAVSSYVRIGAPGDDDAVAADLLAHLRLAADLEAPYLRIFPGGPPSDQVSNPPEPPSADARIVHRLAMAGDAIRHLGVRPVLETHDSHPRGRDVARALGELDRVQPDHRVGAIWDVHHPLLAAEAPADTARWLGPYLLQDRGYVQIKDVREPDDTPAAPGEGRLPLSTVADALTEMGYEGPISLEWERAWHPEVESMLRPLAVTAAWLATRRPGVRPQEEQGPAGARSDADA